jgi:hypothetical protein
MKLTIKGTPGPTHVAALAAGDLFRTDDGRVYGVLNPATCAVVPSRDGYAYCVEFPSLALRTMAHHVTAHRMEGALTAWPLGAAEG